MTARKGGPRVSVGIPVYNGAKYLSQAIDCILGQTFSDLELLISDNNSTDETPDIAHAYAERDQRVRVMRSEVNKGAAWNYRRVFESAKGEYFRWAPADDLFAPDSIAVCVAALDANPDVVLCYPRTDLIDSTGRVIMSYRDNLDLRSCDPVERFRQGLAQIGMVNVIYGLIRASALRRTRLMRNFVGADEVLVLELALQGRFMELEQSRFYRRIHDTAFSQMKTAEEKQEFCDPSMRGKLVLYLWQHYFEYAMGALHASLPVLTKVRLLQILFRSAVGMRGHLLKEAISGARMLLQPRALPRSRPTHGG
jgi:glycosyltransferase involved in cell wall biosynthesis